MIIRFSVSDTHKCSHWAMFETEECLKRLSDVRDNPTSLVGMVSIKQLERFFVQRHPRNTKNLNYHRYRCNLIKE